MKENKGVWIALGCIGIVCLYLAVVFVAVGGFFVYEQAVATEAVSFPTPIATIRLIELIPNEPPQDQPSEKPTLDDLA